MKRIVLEWGLIFSAGAALALAAVWAGTRYVDQSSYHLRIANSPSVRDDLHVILADGELMLCDQFDVEASGSVLPLIINPRRMRAPWVLPGDRIRQLTIPGFDLHYYRFARDGYVIWSVRLSLLIPAAAFVVLALLLRWRLQRHRRQTKPIS